ncbi:hypothetical protein BJ508DRAFT_336252 [Ascobolus immersus RN42]|uniref:Uncharacterized protein n=1 Tax=Ascobolus immersus RN42 TaxID=1160509 RepID=A0A3N4HFP3_ASCIM|nr:hypothetical protein BJ508DRAFT_336252 [Ascobolus immersus RN42]
MRRSTRVQSRQHTHSRLVTLLAEKRKQSAKIQIPPLSPKKVATVDVEDPRFRLFRQVEMVCQQTTPHTGTTIFERNRKIKTGESLTLFKDMVNGSPMVAAKRYNWLTEQYENVGTASGPCRSLLELCTLLPRHFVRAVVECRLDNGQGFMVRWEASTRCSVGIEF